jgi:ABC-type transporter Mla subunit MlaD
MDENVFRIVVTVAVAIASLAFVVQAGIMFALYKATRKTAEGAERFIGKVEPILTKAEPLLEKVSTVVERAGPVIERIGPAIDQALPVIRKAGPVIDETRVVVSKTSRLVDQTIDIATTANGVLADVRPQVKQISLEALEITRLAREQVERVTELLHDAEEKARARLEQIDHGVDHTLEQVENVGGALKRAALKPGKEVSGLAAGVSAAIGTLMRHRRSSVDSATQDEEMFI